MEQSQNTTLQRRQLIQFCLECFQYRSQLWQIGYILRLRIRSQCQTNESGRTVLGCAIPSSRQLKRRASKQGFHFVPKVVVGGSTCFLDGPAWNRLWKPMKWGLNIWHCTKSSNCSFLGPMVMSCVVATVHIHEGSARESIIIKKDKYVFRTGSCEGGGTGEFALPSPLLVLHSGERAGNVWLDWKRCGCDLNVYSCSSGEKVAPKPDFDVEIVLTRGRSCSMAKCAPLFGCSK